MPRPPKDPAEQYSVILPPLRVTKRQAERLTRDAERTGYKKKLSAYRRQCYFKGPPQPDYDGMPVADVLKCLYDIGRMRQYTQGHPALTESLDSLTARLMAVIKPQT